MSHASVAKVLDAGHSGEHLTTSRNLEFRFDGLKSSFNPSVVVERVLHAVPEQAKGHDAVVENERAFEILRHLLVVGPHTTIRIAQIRFEPCFLIGNARGHGRLQSAHDQAAGSIGMAQPARSTSLRFPYSSYLPSQTSSVRSCESGCGLDGP
jgi:hypothetical protein